jgi:predicted DNA-binding transcriptional regulator AlpA
VTKRKARRGAGQKDLTNISIDQTLPPDQLCRDLGSYRGDVFLKEVQVANILGVSVACLRKWRSQGLAPAHTKLGRMVRYSQNALNAFVAGAKGGRNADWD